MKKYTKEEIEKIAYECTMKGLDIEEFLDWLISNPTLEYLSNLYNRNFKFINEHVKVKDSD